jgi:hypothetical protein
VIALLLACAHGRPDVHLAERSKALKAGIHAGLQVAPVVAVRNVPAPPLPAPPPAGPVELELREREEHLPAPTVLDVTDPLHSAFLRNELLGNVRFGGGFIRSGASALEVRARLIELGDMERLGGQGTAWLHEQVEALVARTPHRDAPPIAGPLERRPKRGLDPEDGHDNVNLPRTELVPGSIAEAGPGWLLVPYLRAYLTHNGGWFVGQEYGCLGGARVEVLLVLYRDGAPTWWQAATGRVVNHAHGQPSGAEMDQFLLEAEDQVERQLRAGWPG